MSAFNTVMTKLDDRMNPIVVKELRQAVAGRFVASVLMLFLIVQMVTIGLFLLMEDMDASDFTGGRDVFITLMAILLGTCLLFIPAYASLRLNAERSDTHVDLLYVTTIRPRSIIWGKFLSALIITVLIYSACMPFMSLTFLLRGIDLPTIFLLLAIDFVVVATCVMFSLFLACIPANRVLKSLMALSGLAALIITYGFTIGITSTYIMFGGRTGGGAWDFWAPIVTIVLCLLASTGLLFTLAVAMVSPPTSNRALSVRLYLMSVWLIMGLFCFGWSYAVGDLEPVVFWLCIASVVACAAILVCVSERDQIGPRIQSMIPRFGLLRLGAFVLYSGAAGGIVWILLMSAATFGAAWWWSIQFSSFSHRSDFVDVISAMMPLVGYFGAYALTALFIRHWLLRRFITPSNTYALALIIMAIGTMVPFIVALLAADRPWERLPVGWFITVPFMVFQDRHLYEAQVTASIWLGVSFVLNLRFILSSFAAFKPLETAAPVAEAAAPTQAVS
ncbi:MAG: hypothetical protein GC162_18165 [Planctomycetes bacterium]|nr:hypothetical protein [Planctomycetota bacterium]